MVLTNRIPSYLADLVITNRDFYGPKTTTLGAMSLNVLQFFRFQIVVNYIHLKDDNFIT